MATMFYRKCFIFAVVKKFGIMIRLKRCIIFVMLLKVALNVDATEDVVKFESVLTSDAICLDTKDAVDKFKCLCTNDFWRYIGRRNPGKKEEQQRSSVSEDRVVPYEEYEKFNATRENQLFYAFVYPDSCTLSKLEGICLLAPWSDQGENTGLPLISLNCNIGFPVVRDALQTSEKRLLGEPYYIHRIMLEIANNESEYINHLSEEYGKSAILCVFKPGFAVVTGKGLWRDYISTPVGLYLVNTETGTVLQDFSNYIDTDIDKYKCVFQERLKNDVARTNSLRNLKECQASLGVLPITQYLFVEILSDDMGVGFRDNFPEVLSNIGFELEFFEIPKDVGEMNEYTILKATRKGKGGVTEVVLENGEDLLCTINFANKMELDTFVESMFLSNYIYDGRLFIHPKNNLGKTYVKVDGLMAQIICPFEMLPYDF